MTRVSQLAKELDLKSSLLIEKCQESGFEHIKHHANSLTEEQVDMLRSKLVKGVAKEGASAKKKKIEKIEKDGSKGKDEASTKTALSETALKERRRVPLWKQRAREDLIKGRWKEVTRISLPKKGRRFERRGKEVTKVDKEAPLKKEKEGKVTIELPASVKDVSGILGVRAGDIISKLLMEHNVCVTINQTIDSDVIEMIGLEYGGEVEVKQTKAGE